MFTIFMLIAIWMLDLPQWLQICLTVFGSLELMLACLGSTVKAYKNTCNKGRYL